MYQVAEGALHEAAHAVVAHKLGLDFSHVEVGFGGRGVCHLKAVDRPGDVAVAASAGREAERLAGLFGELSEGDERHGGADLFPACKARQILESNWPAVLRLARQLYHKGQLSEGEVKAIIRGDVLPHCPALRSAGAARRQQDQALVSEAQRLLEQARKRRARMETTRQTFIKNLWDGGGIKSVIGDPETFALAYVDQQPGLSEQERVELFDWLKIQLSLRAGYEKMLFEQVAR